MRHLIGFIMIFSTVAQVSDVKGQVTALTCKCLMWKSWVTIT